MMRTTFVLLILAIFSSCQHSFPEDIQEEYAAIERTIDFNFDIKPILSDKCFHCHGPDDEARKANLRLDKEEYAFKALSTRQGRSISKGHSLESEIILRIMSDDPDYLMPPPDSKLTINEKEIALIAKWIDQGATWEKHWSLIAPTRPELPNSTSEIWRNTNEIDPFILKSIRTENLEESVEADPERLLRRVFMDLTGLPPSINEMDDWLENPSFEQYEVIVDQLLNSDEYAERLAMEWMDVSRYADSHGLHADGWRSMWPWRDWVIKAFRENMPYDEFATWQLAGDLLPDAQKDQILATAFNRNHPMTAEGGAIDEEWRLNYVFDRTETMATAFMGLTMGCAKCHDHKYDPISQKDYFQLAAFFNNIKELGMTGDDGNYGPILLMTNDETDQKLLSLKKSLSELVAERAALSKDIPQLEAFIDDLDKRSTDGLIGHYPLDRIREIEGGKKEYDRNDKCIGSVNATSIDGKYGKAVYFDKDYSELRLQDVGLFELNESFTIGAWIKVNSVDSSKTQTIIGNSGEKNSYWRGWELYLDEENHLSARLIHSLPHNYFHVRTKKAIDTNQWNHVAMSYSGSSKAEGASLFINGKKQDVVVEYNRLTKSMLPIKGGSEVLDERPLVVGKSGRAFTGENGIFRGAIDDIKLFNRPLSTTEVRVAAGIDGDPTTDEMKEVAVLHSDKYNQLSFLISDKVADQMNLIMDVPEIMVMEDLPELRKAYAYHRGEYTAPMYTVTPATPGELPSMSDNDPGNRLGLAKWLFREDHPLTARVAVNRYWQMIFGKGIVSTPEDFGVQGALPSHPELLDWLAIDFIESGWDVRALLKKLVLSATYRQTSRSTEVHQSIDPANIYLARGPSYRWQAEIIRDNALAASGLLVADTGGESVRPYQPEGLWIEKGNFSHKLLRYKETKGDSLYRRSLYTFVKRTSPHPFMTIFDAPAREVCTVKREQTNTPLQSLVLLNDPQFLEAAKVLSERMQREGGEQPRDQISFGFRTATCRFPSDKELELLFQLYKDKLERYKNDEAAAKAYLTVGEYQIDESLPLGETAALALVANTVLNHDDTYMKR